MPMHFNKTGNKEFNNYQRISLIIIFRRENKSIRDFLNYLNESKWISWLGLSKIPKKSTFHDWLELFKMKTIKELFNQLKPKSPKMTAIDGTGFDSFHRSRHYEKRVGFSKMPYAKADLFVDTATKKIIDFSLVNKHQHDIVAAKEFVKRNNLKGVNILCDKGYCLELPDFMGQRSIVECINAVLKRRFLTSLRAKRLYEKREFAWTMIVYNLDRKLRFDETEVQMEISFFILIVWN